MSRWRNVALLLALVVFVTSSRAATICVEQDGSARIEFVGVPCCAEPSDAPADRGKALESNACAGCADTPFGVLTARLKSHDSPLKILITIPTLLFVGEPERATIALRPTPRDDGDSPRATRPSRLRC